VEGGSKERENNPKDVSGVASLNNTANSNKVSFKSTLSGREEILKELKILKANGASR
jgi:hypothetical protein